ncbi:MAG TPA: FAD-dependent oxidoreductase, partial [Chloroflexota bacterium]|nr:FAD-dependent oxidoreductase [Chloroflexota bacterium]
VVGGGNTGVEVASELAEAYPALQLTLVTRQSFARNLSAPARAYIRQAFARLGITFVEKTEIVQVQEEHALAADGRTFRFDACIWVAGFAVPGLAQRSGLRVNERRQIVIDRAMRSLSHPEVYAAGDAAFPLAEPGAPVRMSLYTALLMGAHAADTLAAQLNGRTPSAFGFSYGALALSLGRHDGVVQFLDPNTDAPLKYIFTGSLANRLRETFVKLAVQIIRLQRSLPWIFYWPGKNKLRHVRVDARREVEAGIKDSVTAVQGR